MQSDLDSIGSIDDENQKCTTEARDETNQNKISLEGRLWWRDVEERREEEVKGGAQRASSESRGRGSAEENKRGGAMVTWLLMSCLDQLFLFW